MATRSLPVEGNGGSEHTEALYLAHARAVGSLCRSLLRDRGEAEDATQQVFLSAHRALLNGAAPREPLAWLLAVARNECYARFPQRAATAMPAEEAPDRVTADVSAHVLRAGELASLWDEVRRMPPAQREAFLQREIRGLSYGQLATHLSTTAPSVRSLLLRARRRLRHRLGDVAAAVGGLPWVQALIRVIAGSDGASPVPAAARAVAVGVGALVLAGGGSLPRIVHRASMTPEHAATRHPIRTRVRHVAASPVSVAAATREHRTGSNDHSGRSEGSGSDGSSGDLSLSASGDPSKGGGDGGGDGTQAPAPIVQATTGGDGSGDATTTATSIVQNSSDGGTSGSASTSDGGSDGGSGTVTTTTSSGSSGDGNDGGGSTDGS